MKKTILTTTIVFILGMGIQQNAHADLKDGLVAHWSFDDCRATDNSGNGHDGIINGNPQCVDGVKGKAFSFDGVHDFIDVGNIKLFSSNKPVTIMAWVNVENTANTYWSPIVSKWSYELDKAEWVLGYHYKNLSFIEGYDLACNCSDISSDKFDAQNEKMFVGIKLDGNTVSYIKNGVIVDTDINNYQFTDTDVHLKIGGSNENLYFFKGLIDDLRIYNRALTEAEVLELYNGGGVVSTKSVLVVDTGNNGTCSATKTAAMQIGGSETVSSSSAAEVCSNAYPVVKVESALSKITDKVQLNELQKLLATDVLNELVFSNYSNSVVNKYNTFLTAEKNFKPTVKNLYAKVEALNKKKIALQASVLPRKMPKVTALQQVAKINNKLAQIGSSKNATEIAKYKDVKKELEAVSYAKGGGLAKAAKIGGGALTAITTGMAIYEITQDFQNIREGKNVIYDSAKLGWNLTSATGGVLTLTQLAGLTSETAFSNVLSKSATFLLIPQVVAAGYKWGQETYLLKEWDALQSSHQSMLDLRYLKVDTIVDELAKVQTTDELTDRLYAILRSYPHDSGVKTLVETFDDYLNNTGFLKRTFKKSTAKDLTDLELAEIAAVYALGDVAVAENIKFRERAKLERFTEFNFLGGEGINVFDVVAGALSGKDAYQKQLDFMNQVNTLLKYDETANVRDRFDSSFNHKFVAEFRKLGEQVYYYEKLGY